MNKVYFDWVMIIFELIVLDLIKWNLGFVENWQQVNPRFETTATDNLRHVCLFNAITARSE